MAHLKICNPEENIGSFSVNSTTEPDINKKEKLESTAEPDAKNNWDCYPPNFWDYIEHFEFPTLISAQTSSLKQVLKLADILILCKYLFPYNK